LPDICQSGPLLLATKKQLMYLLRLLRIQNLIIVALTQYLLRWCILQPAAQADGLSMVLDGFHFFLLVLSTILIAAGGYVINDVADQGIDAINKPTARIIGRLLSEKQAMRLYHGINLLGFGIAFYLANYVGDVRLVWLFPLAALLLWLYAHYFKRMLLTGNILVALFCAFVALIVLFSERFLFYQMSGKHTNEILILFSGYALFAYLSTMFREVVKDMEDMEGDKLNNCQTLPIVLGIRWAKVIAAIFGLSLLLFLGLLIIWLHQFGRLYDVAFILIGIILPLAWSLWLLAKAKSIKDFHHLSQWAKWLMLSGLLYLPIYQWL
jgi:4-hydroxybenzoate polyprenyltransferase